MFQTAIGNASGDEYLPMSVYLMLMRCMERLVLAGVLNQKDTDSLIKLAVDKYVLKWNL